MRELWPHQSRAIELLWQAMAEGHRRPMLMMPTGSGKTDTAIDIVKRARAKDRRVVFTVPAIELIDQTLTGRGPRGGFGGPGNGPGGRGHGGPGFGGPGDAPVQPAAPDATSTPNV